MRILLAILLVLAAATPVRAQEAVYVIRHAEKEAGADPALTPEGRRRAAAWAGMLGRAGLGAILTSDAARTRETGAIIGDALGLDPVALPVGDTAGLLDTLEFDHEADRVLVVAHAETIPGILKGLGVEAEVAVDEGDFANLFVVLNAGSDAPSFLHLVMPGTDG